jgi:hypothetical protein
MIKPLCVRLFMLVHAARCAALVWAASLCAVVCAQGVHADVTVPDSIAAQIASSGTARVIVLLDVPFAPEGTLSAAAAAQQRQALAAAQDAFVSEVVKGSASKVINRLAWMPAVVLEIDAPTFERIQRSRRVKAVEPDQMMQPTAPAALPGAPQ